MPRLTDMKCLACGGLEIDVVHGRVVCRTCGWSPFCRRWSW